MKQNVLKSFTVTRKIVISGVIFCVLITGVFVYDLKNASAVAGINRTINFQGKLVSNPQKTNVSNTSYTVVFSIYDRANGGTALWSETQTVTTADGIFRVNLGSVTPFPANFNFNWDGLYLGMKVEADTEMIPRIQLAAVPYAFNAEKVSGLTVQDDAGNASTSATLRIANNKTVTITNGLTFSGADSKTINFGSNSIAFTTSADATLTLPTTGTLATLAGSEIFTNKTIGSTGLVFSGATTDITTSTNENFVVSPNGTGRIGFNTTSPLAGVDIRSSINTFAVASVSGSTPFSAFLVDNNGNGDLFTASKSGATKFAILNNGNLQFAGTTNFLTTLASAATLNRTLTIPNSGSTDTFCLQTAANCGSASINYWQQALGGVIAQGNLTQDILFGSLATSSAKFAFTNAGSTSLGTPTASISANSGNNATFLTGAGVLGTTNRQTLSLGGLSTGNIQFNPGGLTNPNLFLKTNGDIGVNTTNPLATIDIRANTANSGGTIPVASVAGSTSFASMVVNNSGVGDILTASKSGATKFVVKNDGKIGLDIANYSNCGTITTDALAMLSCGAAGSSLGDTLLTVYVISEPAGNNLTINFNGAANSQPSSSSGTITFPSNASKLLVEARAGGGGGGGTGATNAIKNAGGGGEGGYSREFISSLSNTYYVKVGAGGNGGAAGGINAGAQGTSTCIGTNASDACSSAMLSTSGGSGGAGINSAVTAAGGAGGSASGGDLNIQGQSGFASGAVATSNFSGAGGGAGGGRQVTVTPANGNNGSSGGGGSGAGGISASTTTRAGGRGGDGYVVFYVYKSGDGSASSWNQFANGVLAPDNLTTDVLIGGNSTSSAKFGILSVNGSLSPVASLSATTSSGGTGSGLVFDSGTSSIQSLLRNTLTIGGNTTGAIQFNAGGNGTLYIKPNGDIGTGSNNTNPLASFDIRANTANSGGTVSVASVSGQTSFAALVSNNSGVGDLFSASKSGATKFTVTNNGNIQFAGTTNFLTTLASAATLNRTLTIPNSSATDTFCLQTAANCVSASVNLWQQASGGVLAPGNLTQDILFGATATSSSKFAFTNAGSTSLGTPTASISAQNAGGQTLILGGDGSIQTSRNNTLALGGSSTGNITLTPSFANGLINVLTGNLKVGNGSNGVTLDGEDAYIEGTLEVDGNAQFDGISFLASNATTVTLGSSGTDTINIGNSGADTIGIGNAAANSTITIGNASAQNVSIFDNNWNVTTAGAGSFVSLAITSSLTANSSTGSNIQCLLGGATASWGTCETEDLWQINSKVVSQSNNSFDVMFGGAATTSSKFAFIGNAGSATPVASISAQNAGGQALILSGDGSIQTSRNNTLSLGGNTTGDILLNSGTNNIRFDSTDTSLIATGLTTITSNVNLGISATSLTLGAGSSATIATTTNGLSLDSGSNTLTIAASDTNLTANGLTTLTAGVLATIDAAAALSIDSTTLNLGNGSAATIGTTANNSNLYFVPNGVGRIGFNTTSPLAGIDLRSSFNTLAVASISGSTPFAALLVDQRGSGDIFTASTAGVPRFSITSVGGIKIGELQGLVGECLKSGGSGASLSWGTCGGGAAGTWSLNTTNGTHTPINNTADLLIGGVSTASALFKITGLSSAVSNLSVGIGAISSPLGLLNIEGAYTGKALTILNQLGNQDIFTASSSGTSRFALGASGEIKVGSAGNLSSGISGQCLISSGNGAAVGWGGCASGAGAGWFTLQSAQGTLYPVNTTLDLFVGGTSTSSAKFAVLNSAGSTAPVASLSATTSSGGNGSGLVFDSGTSSIQSLRRNTLTIGGSTTGAVQFSAGGNSTFFIRSNGDIGAGLNNTSPRASFDIRANTANSGGTTAVASVSGQTSFAALVANNSGRGDIFTASNGGRTIFTVKQDSVQVGTGSAGAVNPVLFRLDNKVNNGDPIGGVNGSMYYNAGSNKFRCYENSEWKDCISGDTTKYLNTQHDNATATGTEVTGLSTTLAAGTYAYKYFLRVRSSTLAVGLDFGINYTGSTTSFTAVASWMGTGTTASTGTIDDANTGDGAEQIVEGSATRTLSTTAPNMNVMTAVATINQDNYVTIEGILIVSTSGDIELWHASDTTNTTSIMTGSSLIITKINQGADLAEIYSTSDESIGPGDVVSLDSELKAGVKKSTKPYDNEAFGIISTSPSLVMGTLDDAGKKPVLVAFSGRVPVKVTTENGPIKPGDLLTSSSIPGVAMKATKAGQVIGQAMNSYDKDGIGKIMAFIKTDVSNGDMNSIFENPNVKIESSSFSKDALDELLNRENDGLTGSEVVTDTLIAAKEIVTPKLTVNELHANKIVVGQIEGLIEYDNRIKMLEEKVATISANLTLQKTLNVQVEYSTFSAKLEENNAKIDAQNKLMKMISDQLASSSANTSTNSSNTNYISDSLVVEKLRVRGSSMIEGVLNVVDSIITNNFIANGLSTFFGDAIFKSKVSLDGPVTFNNEIAGSAVIQKGDEKVGVKFDKEFEELPLINTSIVFDEQKDEEGNIISSEKIKDEYFRENYDYIVVDKSKSGFVIVLNKEAKQDISFTWTALRVKEARSIQSRKE